MVEVLNAEITAAQIYNLEGFVLIQSTLRFIKELPNYFVCKKADQSDLVS